MLMIGMCDIALDGAVSQLKYWHQLDARLIEIFSFVMIVPDSIHLLCGAHYMNGWEHNEL